MINKHAKKYFINLHFMERTDSLKVLNSKILCPNGNNTSQ